MPPPQTNCSNAKVSLQAALQGLAFLSCAIILVLVLLLTNLKLLVFNLDYYDFEYRHLERSAATGMTEEELLRVTKQLLFYLKGEQDDLRITANISNRLVPLFSEKELIHLEDVRMLFHQGLFVYRTIILLLVAVQIFSAPFCKKGTYLETVFLALRRIALVGLIFTVAAVLAFYTNFDFWFTAFHEVLFDNDFWLLDPARDNLIKMFPLQFFSNITFRVVGMTICQVIIIFTGSSWYLSKKRGKAQDDLRAGTG